MGPEVAHGLISRDQHITFLEGDFPSDIPVDSGSALMAVDVNNFCCLVAGKLKPTRHLRGVNEPHGKKDKG